MTWLIGAGRALSLVFVSCSLQACGGGGDGPSGAASGLLTQAPHCAAGTDALRMEGTLDGAGVNDQRTANSNAGLVNIGEPSFDTPFVNFAALGPTELEIHFKWTQSLAYGQTDAISTGNLVAPSGAAHAGQTLCITSGHVGFVDGGTEDGALKFRVDELRAGADCAGDVVPVELRGCFNSAP